MNGYKIHYRDIDQDNWVDYDNVVYIQYYTVEQIMKDVKEQFRNKIFEIYNINIE